MAQQTAVEWLQENINEFNWEQVFKIAKQMEKEQIINSIVQCAHEYKITHDEAEQYYNETYNK